MQWVEVESSVGLLIPAFVSVRRDATEEVLEIETTRLLPLSELRSATNRIVIERSTNP
jgi:hypothetical protein